MFAPRVWKVCLAVLIAAPGAYADHYFYSVADNDFRNDNDRFWSALEVFPEWDASRAVLRDDWYGNDRDRTDGRDTIYDDLLWYSSNLNSGDVFMFSFWGHGGWGNVDFNSDDGSTPQPESNDPAPANDGPYQYDEFFGNWDLGNDLWPMFDDDLTATLADFDPSVEVIIISGACHSGGWVGGANDIQTSVPATNNALYAMLGAPEQGTGIGVGPTGGPYEILLCTALTNTIEAYMNMDAWYAAAMNFGSTTSHRVQREWATSAENYYFWPDEAWVPTPYEATYQTDHWGWEETYLQLRPEQHSWLDAGHDNYIGTPEPATAVLLLMGLAGLHRIKRRRES